MRTLKFVVENQIVKQDPNCDFDNLIPGTEGYLRAEFSFSPEWTGFNKVVAFWSPMGKEFPPQALLDGKSCKIPVEALKRRVFKIQVLGGWKGQKMITNKLAVRQDGGKV